MFYWSQIILLCKSFRVKCNVKDVIKKDLIPAELSFGGLVSSVGYKYGTLPTDTVTLNYFVNETL